VISFKHAQAESMIETLRKEEWRAFMGCGEDGVEHTPESAREMRAAEAAKADAEKKERREARKGKKQFGAAWLPAELHKAIVEEMRLMDLDFTDAEDRSVWLAMSATLLINQGIAKRQSAILERAEKVA
jgi:hypothetical protein